MFEQKRCVTINAVYLNGISNFFFFLTFYTIVYNDNNCNDDEEDDREIMCKRVLAYRR